jgi:uncharacterized membrane protein YeaQ/YmgE (transglycosylase-associated protein family)
MGILSWLLGGAVAFAAGRFIPLARRPGWRLELAAALTAALLAGFIATALDFGGLDEPDPRAIAFATLVAFALVGITRLASIASTRKPTA